MRKLSPKLSIRLTVLVAALVASAGLTFVASQTTAMPAAAGTDAEIRPDFGALIQPPIRRWHPHPPVWNAEPAYGWRGGYGDRFRGVWVDRSWRENHGYPLEGPVRTITVDCGDPAEGPTPIGNALDAVEDGGTIYIRPSGRACTESLVITRPVTIIGEPVSAFLPTGGDNHPAAAIAPPPGMPCIRIGPGVPAVELRDLTFVAGQAGSSPCIEGWASRLALTHTHIEYVGDASALFLSGGQLIAHESEIHALSYDPAVVLENVTAELHRVHINAASTGLDISLADGGGLSLDHVDVAGVVGADPSASPDIGIMIHRSRGQPSRIDLRNTRVSGFTTGIWFQRGGVVNVLQTMISRARVGLLSEGVDLTLADSSIEARRTGIYVTSGHAEITRNRIFGFTDLPIDTEPSAVISVHENWIYPADDCHRFRERYSRWCRDSHEVPEIFRDHGDRRDEDHWGWEGGPFDAPPPPPPPERHGWW